MRLIIFFILLSSICQAQFEPMILVDKYDPIYKTKLKETSFHYLNSNGYGLVGFYFRKVDANVFLHIKLSTHSICSFSSRQKIYFNDGDKTIEVSISKYEMSDHSTHMWEAEIYGILQPKDYKSIQFGYYPNLRVESNQGYMDFVVEAEAFSLFGDALTLILKP